MKDINQDIKVAFVFSIIAFITIIAFVVTGFSSNVTTGLVLLRNYGVAIGVISVVFTRTANHEQLNHGNMTAHSIAFKLGMTNVVLSIVFFFVFALMF